MFRLIRSVAVLCISVPGIVLCPVIALAQFPPEYGDSLTGTADKPAIRLPAPKPIQNKRLPDNVLADYIKQGNDNPKFRYEFHLLKMKDGAELATHVTLPPEGNGPWPVVFMRGPYGAINYSAMFGPGAATSGWVYVSQDMRGRWHSPGSDAVVFMNDGWGKNRDAHETLNWLSEQDWFNGNVVSWGGSALGITQIMAAPGAPDVLKAQSISQGFSNYYHDAAYRGGCFREVLFKGWLDDNKFDPENLQQIIAHSTYDDFWENGNALAQSHRVNVPAVFVGGWYDIFSQATLNSFTQVHNFGGPRARGNCRLIMRPGGHAYLAKELYPKIQTDELHCVNFMKFLAHHGMEFDPDIAGEKAVHYYVQGDTKDPTAPGNFWRHQDNWPPSYNAKKLWLHADGKLSADAPPPQPGSRKYSYDPAHPVPTIGGNNMRIAAGPLDQRPIEDRPDVLLFTTDLLEEPLEVTGHIYARLFAESNCPDTDFSVRVSDVYPDGSSILVSDGILKARFREDFRREVLMEEGTVYEFPIDLWSTSYIVNRGHRIRVAVTSSNWPQFTPNPNNGKKFSLDDDDIRIADNTIHFSPNHPSHILLPVYAGPTNEDPEKPWGERLIPEPQGEQTGQQTR